MPHSRRTLATWPLLPLLLLATTPAGATYSIAATDQATQQVGGTVTSCVGSSGVTIVYGPAPGFGAINAQATVVSTANRDMGVQLLQMGVAPADVIQQINASDSGSASRQYGVVDLQGRAAGFTGSACSPYANHVTGTVGTFTYSIQGNILTGSAVLTQAETAFRNPGCDLAERLMLALEGGAKNGNGDSRCTNDAGTPVPANAAMIEVDLAGQPAGSYLRLTNAKNGRVNAVTALRAQFDTWRQTHPCMQPEGGTPDAGPKDASVGDVLNDRLDGADTSVPADASDGSAGSAGQGGSAGSAGKGGASGASGTSGTGGLAGTAGAGTGGIAGTAGAGTGGTAGTGTGGAAGTGDGGPAGGAAGKGGAAGSSASGGSAGTGTAGANGTGGTGGASGSAGAGGSSAGTSTTGGRGGSGGSSGSAGSGGSDDSGCSCRVGRPGSARAAASFMLSGVALIFAARARRQKRRTRDA